MLNRMNSAFHRLKVRKVFRPEQGWLRTTEDTRGSDGSSHPHFHTPLPVPPRLRHGSSYFTTSTSGELCR
ncbi:protein rep, partial [Salmonella enterica]|uniref:protein rep n=1 Tax=Salmonella enterica TaxID=28901 RepID=UPI00398C64B6